MVWRLTVAAPHRRFPVCLRARFLGRARAGARVGFLRLGTDLVTVLRCRVTAR